MKKKLIICATVVVLAVAAVLGGIKIYRIHERDQSGILLAFDDYTPDSWEAYFDLFDEYGVKATFFVILSEPTEFCYEAIDRGHEIGFHTMSHENLRDLSEDEVYEQAIAPIEVFREKGIELTSFAYPYGGYTEELNEMLLEHYKTLRGAFFGEIYGKYQLREGFVESFPLDNGKFDSMEEYEEKITEILTAVKEGKGVVVPLYSHAIGVGDWNIAEDKLRFLLQKAKELDLKFYTFQELQD